MEFLIHGMKPKQQQQPNISHSNDSARRDNKLKPQLHSLWSCRDWCHPQISEREWWLFLWCPYLNSTIWLVKSDRPWTVTANHSRLPQWWCWLQLQLQMCPFHWDKQTQLVVAICSWSAILSSSFWLGRKIRNNFHLVEGAAAYVSSVDYSYSMSEDVDPYAL